MQSLIQIVKEILLEAKNAQTTQKKKIDKNLSRTNPEHAIFKYNLGKKIGSSGKTAYEYNDNPNYIIKDFDKDFYNSNIEEEYMLSQKYPKYFAHILKFDLKNNIMVQEKVNTSEVLRDEAFFKSKYKVDLIKVSDKVINGMDEQKPIPLKYWKEKITDLNDFNKFKKYYDFYLNILKIFDKENIDENVRGAHLGNIGFDKQGNLKVFDLD